MATELLQIVPMLPPLISGVGDYALLLAQELASVHGVQTRFVNGDPGWQGQVSVEPFLAGAVSERSARALSEALGNTAPGGAVLLHYVGYGYARRGCPFWLVRGLEAWKRRAGGTLTVLFHEVSGSGPIWTSGFWTSGVQDWLAKRLARLADCRRTTTEYGARQLRAKLPAADAAIRTLAVFSTLGEPIALAPYAKRRRQMVVFGDRGFRLATYTRHLPDFVETCQRLRIERVIDIGRPLDFQPQLPVPFIQTGILAAPEASAWMNSSSAGYFTYPLEHIEKSTIFAAYCAHGVTPVTFAANPEHGDGSLRLDEHYLAPAGKGPADEDQEAPARIAAAAHSWYQAHRLAIHAREIRQTLAGG